MRKYEENLFATLIQPHGKAFWEFNELYPVARYSLGFSTSGDEGNNHQLKCFRSSGTLRVYVGIANFFFLSFEHRLDSMCGPLIRRRCTQPSIRVNKNLLRNFRVFIDNYGARACTHYL